MKRFVVSLIFILIATTFTWKATAGFERIRSWSGKIHGRGTAPICHRLVPSASALMSAMKGQITTVRFDWDRPLLVRNCAIATQPGVLKTNSRAEGKELASSQHLRTHIILFKFVGSGYLSGAFDSIKNTVRQMDEVLGLMRTR